VVNRASRLVDAASPGTAAMDEAYRSLIEDVGHLTLEPLGPHHLKGIGTTSLWRLTPASTDEFGRSQQS
jgi:class 3 adenylate cyclase